MFSMPWAFSCGTCTPNLKITSYDMLGLECGFNSDEVLPLELISGKMHAPKAH